MGKNRVIGFIVLVIVLMMTFSYALAGTDAGLAVSHTGGCHTSTRLGAHPPEDVRVPSVLRR